MGLRRCLDDGLVDVYYDGRYGHASRERDVFEHAFMIPLCNFFATPACESLPGKCVCANSLLKNIKNSNSPGLPW